MRRIGLLAISLAAALLGGCAFVDVPLMKAPQPLAEQVLEGKGSKKVLIVDISGTIGEQARGGGLLGRGTPSTVSLVREALQKAENDPKVAALILRINSPGGTVTASDIIRHDLTAFRKRRNLPVSACIMGIGASGGYYVATAADEITAHPTAVTGSIGVLLMTFNVEGLLGKIGVEEKTIKSGEKKDLLSPFRRATPDEERLVQGIIDQFHGRFVEMIQERPGNRIPREELLKLADGRIFSAADALKFGLIDRVGYLDDVIASLRQRIGDPAARVVTYFRPGGYKGSIYAGTADDPSLAERLGGWDAAGGGEFMYLWKP
ncbi:signal peptide peptidase SppA [Geobacter pickeringii]|uniref:Signal peptide peptidase SppA n=1 Tax=Geobacter pickeringii TaxID=345632 RepID=A0A0B5BIV1_9BACT|nr:signal peptide peptidase SppA [Geobacter pickeringii]AJE03981.1 signal peptide peptidase SppA [Geobacter pickeringii]